MATYTKETALYDTGAIAGDISDASETASNYLTDITGGGVYVHSADTSSDPTAATAKGVKITDQIDIIRGGDSVAAFGEEVRVGTLDNSYLQLSDDGICGVSAFEETFFRIDTNAQSGSYSKHLTGSKNNLGTTSNSSAHFPMDSTCSLRVSTYDSNDDQIAQNTFTFTKNTSQTISDNTTNLKIAYNGKSEYIFNTLSGTIPRVAYQFSATVTTGMPSFSFGNLNNNEPPGAYSVAMGSSCLATNFCSFAEGHVTEAYGDSSHAEGKGSKAYGEASHAQGRRAIARKKAQTVIGVRNVEDTSNSTTHPSEDADFGAYSLIIGNGQEFGTEPSEASNALTVDWQGRVACGNYSGTLTSIFDLFYPVGSYYETSDTTFDPNTAWGGTWTLETAGKFHVSAGTGYTAGSTGGSPYIQAHTHSFTNPTYKITQTAANVYHSGEYVSVDQTVSWGTGALASGSTYKYLRSTTSPSASVSRTNPTIPEKAITRVDSGSVGAINTSGLSTGTAGNMPPYIAVNRWHRTA